MLIDPIYPDAQSDARLFNVQAEWKRLHDMIDNADWDGTPVSPADRERCKMLRRMMHDGVMYTAKF